MRLAVMAHFDVHGQLAPHVRRHVESLAEAVQDMIVVSTAELEPEARRWLSQRVQLLVRPNHGYDFFSWRTGLSAAGDLTAYDEVLICNDSFVGPLVPYTSIFETMAARPVDFWGFTRSDRVSPHIQSFLVAFRPWLVASNTFRRFWSRLIATSERRQVILQQEVGLSRTLTEAGFVCGAYFEPTEEDEEVARARMRWWAAHRQVKGHRRPPANLVATRSEEPYNPAIALADRALTRRLPLVKIDTLRYDPYGLGSSALLSACEREMPDQFEGVREFLARTASHYPMRPEERLVTTPSRHRPRRALVRY